MQSASGAAADDVFLVFCAMRLLCQLMLRLFLFDQLSGELGIAVQSVHRKSF